MRKGSDKCYSDAGSEPDQDRRQGRGGLEVHDLWLLLTAARSKSAERAARRCPRAAWRCAGESGKLCIKGIFEHDCSTPPIAAKRRAARKRIDPIARRADEALDHTAAEIQRIQEKYGRTASPSLNGKY